MKHAFTAMKQASTAMKQRPTAMKQTSTAMKELFSKRQARAPEIMNEVSSYRDPLMYNEWPVYTALPRAAPRYVCTSPCPAPPLGMYPIMPHSAPFFPMVCTPPCLMLLLGMYIVCPAPPRGTYPCLPQTDPRFRYPYPSVAREAYGRVVTKAPPNVVRTPDYDEVRTTGLARGARHARQDVMKDSRSRSQSRDVSERDGKLLSRLGVLRPVLGLASWLLG
ncbi:unnamed protein product [Plutella xylostella]|uniref:(diamondback moth) hypothetical protein n=1 Tax=Plutella xylostella TaxID=51655 RepID=A0A8S4E1M4_PLUXY|nr:unnamed protein product [Plutella xylostella]